MIDRRDILVTTLEDYLAEILVDVHSIEDTVLNKMHTTAAERKFIESVINNIKVTSDKLTNAMVDAIGELR